MFWVMAGKNIMPIKTLFLRVTSHIDFRGNEKPDSADKSALDLLRVKVGVLYIDFGPY